MAGHPYGPWSESSGSIRNISLMGGNGVSSVLMKSGKTTSRSGYNQGADHTTPTPASRVDLEYELQRLISATARTKTAPYLVIDRDFGWEPMPGSQEPGISPDVSSSENDDKAFQKLIQNQNEGFKSIPFLGEFKETVGTAKHLSEIVTGRHNKAYQLLVKNLVKRKRGSFSDVTKEIAEANLELQFGILPALTDFSGLMDAIKTASLNEKPAPSRMRGSYVTEQTKSSRGSINYSFQVETRNEMRCKIISKFGATVNSEAWAPESMLQRDFGFSARDILPGLWELTPYSWLVDYFSNASDFVNLSSLRRGVTSNGWKITIVETTWNMTAYASKYNDSSFQLIAQGPGAYRKRSFSFTRSKVNLDTYIPTPRLEAPNLQQVANIASLAASRLIRTSPSLMKEKLNIRNSGYLDSLRSAIARG